MPSSDLSQLRSLASAVDQLRAQVAERVVGQRAAVDGILTAVLSGGHALLVGVPGLAKTLMVSTVAEALNLSFNRVQFTPDLMPGDITGTELVEEDPASGKRQFRFVPGPIFAQVVLADEINRTPPKTQAALLQAMQEHHVTVAGQTYPLPAPFFVLATQNPIEQEGTYPLPEAQLDRFMLEIRLGYPARSEEEAIVAQTTGAVRTTVAPVLDGAQLLAMQELVRRIPVSESLIASAVMLARMTRPSEAEAPALIREYVEWGAGPRASQYLVLGAKARAAMDGRPQADLDDVRSVALDVLRHRVMTNFAAEAADRSAESVISELISAWLEGPGIARPYSKRPQATTSHKSSRASAAGASRGICFSGSQTSRSLDCGGCAASARDDKSPTVASSPILKSAPNLESLMSNSHRLSVITAALLLAAACGDSATDDDPKPPAGVASVTIETSGPLDFVSLGLTQPLVATARDASGDAMTATIAWTSQDQAVARVNPTGVVTSQGNGSTTITATAGDKSATITVNVEQVAAALVVTASATTLTMAGNSSTITAAVRDANSRAIAEAPITWGSSNESVVAVDEAGKAFAVGPGNATITATSGSESATVGIEVKYTGDVGDAIVGQAMPCTGGMAGPFPCQGVTLMSFLPNSGVRGDATDFDLNDLWGWVDPQTQREYVIQMKQDGAAFIDITDPLRPRYLGQLPIPGTARANIWHDVKVYQNHAFIVADAANQHGMQVFDLTRLRGITVPRNFTADAHYTQIASAHNIFINTTTGYAYSVGGSSGGTTCGGGLHMIDIRNPRAPVFAGCFFDPATGWSGTGYTHDVQCVAYHGPDAAYTGREICFGSNESALSIADVTIKTAPVAISHAGYPGVSYSHQGWLTADHRHFLMNDELDELYGAAGTTRTLVWDVADLDDPVLVNEYYGPTGASDHNHYIHDGMMYASNYTFGMRIVDVSNPLAPTQVGFIDTAPHLANTPGFNGSWSNYPFFPSGNIAISSGGEGLFIVRRQ